VKLTSTVSFGYNAQVKRYENGFIDEPAVLGPTDRVSDLDQLKKERNISVCDPDGFPLDTSSNSTLLTSTLPLNLSCSRAFPLLRTERLGAA
jgi:hypothetical protein